MVETNSYKLRESITLLLELALNKLVEIKEVRKQTMIPAELMSNG